MTSLGVLRLLLGGAAVLGIGAVEVEVEAVDGSCCVSSRKSYLLLGRALSIKPVPKQFCNKVDEKKMSHEHKSKNKTIKKSKVKQNVSNTTQRKGRKEHIKDRREDILPRHRNNSMSAAFLFFLKPAGFPAKNFLILEPGLPPPLSTSSSGLPW